MAVINEIKLNIDEQERVQLIQLVSTAFTGGLTLDMYTMSEPNLNADPWEGNDAYVTLQIKPDHVGRGPDTENVYYRRVTIPQFFQTRGMTYEFILTDEHLTDENITAKVDHIFDYIDQNFGAVVTGILLPTVAQKRDIVNKLKTFRNNIDTVSHIWTLNANPQSDTLKGSIDLVFKKNPPEREPAIYLGNIEFKDFSENEDYHGNENVVKAFIVN